MNASAPQHYLETAVLTSPPQKLQLMLVEGCLRFGQRARDCLQAGRFDDSTEAMIRCQEIAAQLLAGIRPEFDPELSRGAAGVYAFVHRSFVLANLQRDAQRLNEALSVLEIERETWRLACEGLSSQATAPMQETRSPDAPSRLSLNA